MQPELIPHVFKCPICFEILRLPHTSLCGHTCCLGCWMKLSGDEPKINYILGNLATIAMACPVCRRTTLVGPNHSLRSHIEENYTKEITETLYAKAVESLAEEIRETIRKENISFVERERLATRPPESYEPMQVRNEPMQVLYVSRGRFWDRIKNYFWKFIGLNIVLSAILVPIAASVVLSNRFFSK